MADEANPPDDKKVRELIDAGTRADLERWFGLPSFEQLADQGVKPTPTPAEDPDVVEQRRRLAAALAAVDPAFLESHRRRTTLPPDFVKFTAAIEPRVSDDLVMVDLSMIERQHRLGEPREYELPSDLPDDLKIATPQALLRDLHRPELSFDKQFEITDALAELRVDARAVIAEAIAFRPTLPDTEGRHREARTLLVEVRELRHRPWKELTVKMPNRRVTE